MFQRLLRLGGIVTIVASSLVVGLLQAQAGAATPKHGGAVTVAMVNSVWLNLDPALDPNGITDQQYMDAIFGDLFIQLPGSKIGYGLATGYSFANHNQLVTINLRKGVVFSDGTPFNAQAVATNINRDLTPSYACGCLNDFSKVTSAVAQGKYTVVLHISQPDPSIIQAFIDNAPNWIASPTALSSTPASTFGQMPVGAGPFEVQSNIASTKLVLVKNPHFYLKGQPYLSSVTFLNTSQDAIAYGDLQSGAAQLVIGMSTVPLIEQAKAAYHTILVKGVTTSTLELNTKKAPLNNLLAREAILDATDPAQIANVVAPGVSAVSEDVGPGGSYYEKSVPGYFKYNPSKAQSLVNQIGGLSITIEGGTTASAGLELGALQTQLQAAGIKVTLKPESLTVEEVNLANNNWIAVTGGEGGVDPDVGPQSLATRFSSSGRYTCCDDATLDGMINQSTQIADPTTRTKLFDSIYKYIAKNAYTDDLYATASAVVATPQLASLTALPSASGALTPDIDWPNLWLK